MTGEAWCLLPGCPWRVTGDTAVVELEARRHTADKGLKGGPVPPHPTYMQSLP